MNEGWYINYDGETHMIKESSVLYLESRYITELVIPNGVKEVWGSSNYLTKLDLPDTVEWIDLRFNGLTELIIPDGCMVHCDPNVNVITRTMFNRSNRLKAILK